MFRAGARLSIPSIARCALAATACLLGVPGCAAPGGAERGSERVELDPAGSVPGDLTVEVSVKPGRGVTDRAKVEERAVRFVLLPDGSLHGETDAALADSVRPARARRLAREQMADVWTMLRSAGFADGSLAETRANPSLIEPDAGRILATLEIHANGERFAFVRRYEPGGEDEAAMRRVVRSLASLAWASDEALVESAELPKRYDLGVDPYARFAKPAADAGGK